MSENELHNIKGLLYEISCFEKGSELVATDCEHDNSYSDSDWSSGYDDYDESYDDPDLSYSDSYDSYIARKRRELSGRDFKKVLCPSNCRLGIRFK